MMRRNLLLLLMMVFVADALAQPGTVRLTPVRDLRLQAQPLEIPARFRGLIQPQTVNLPAGFRAKVFYIGRLNKPRFLAWSPDSVLHVANYNSGEILALPDRDRDGVADTAIVAASGFTIPHDVKFYKGDMYVAEERRVWRLRDLNRDGIYEQRSVFIDNIAEGATQPGGGHRTRTLAFDETRRKVYLSIGSLCNVCREEFRAVVEEYNDDGTGKRIFASGIRNAVGLTIHPRTGRLWATNNGSDQQGNDIPPEWIDLVRDGGFYGYPFAHSNQVYFDFSRGGDYQALLPITAADSAKVRRMVQPAALVQAHSAPMAITFTNNSFPNEFRRGAFVAFRGSWNRTPATGYKVVYLDFDNDMDTTANAVADFLTGFMTDSSRAQPARWARPVGLEVDWRGNLYVGSDESTNAIFIISPSSTANTGKDRRSELDFRLDQNYPNPFNPVTTITYSLPATSFVTLRVFDMFGREVVKLVDEKQIAGTYQTIFNGVAMASGVYFYRLTARSARGEFSDTRKMMLLK